MRQAGRYLPEYRELRKKAPSFLNFCLSPELASEATLQPMNRFDLDAAIIFADILLIPFSLGQKIAFKENIGPVLIDIKTEDLSFSPKKLEPVYETIRLSKKNLEKSKALFGFAGGPWSVACYMIQGNGKDGFRKAVSLQRERPEELSALMEKVFSASVFYLKKQIASGVDVLQIFESHAGLLKDDEAFDRWIVEPTRKIVEAIRADFPCFPIVGFPRGANIEKKQRYFRTTGVTALSLDQQTILSQAKEKLAFLGVLQGNLDPALLIKGGKDMRDAAEKIVNCFGRRHIFNLGHGVLPQTPPENVRELINLVHEMDVER